MRGREGEKRRVISSPLGAERGDGETLAVCVQGCDMHTHTHTPVTDFEVTFWRACVTAGQVRQIEDIFWPTLKGFS